MALLALMQMNPGMMQMHQQVHGGWWGLGWLFQLLILLLFFLVHGALWLAIRTSGDLQERAVRTAAWIWLPLLLTAVAFLVYSAVATTLYANYLEGHGR